MSVSVFVCRGPIWAVGTDGLLLQWGLWNGFAMGEAGILSGGGLKKYEKPAQKYQSCILYHHHPVQTGSRRVVRFGSAGCVGLVFVRTGRLNGKRARPISLCCGLVCRMGWCCHGDKEPITDMTAVPLK